MERFDVAVVGGGMSGWIAAAFAAEGGRRVVLLERADTLGGRARTLTLKAARLNLGAHAVYLDGELAAALKALGIALSGGAPSLSSHGLARGNVFPLPSSFGKLLRSPLLGVRGKVELARTLTKLKGLNPDRLPRESFSSWLDRNVHDPMVRSLLCAFAQTATYYTEPAIQGARSVLRQLQFTLNGGAFYPDEGWGGLVNALKRKAEGLGVQAYPGSRAQRVALLDESRAGDIRAGRGRFVIECRRGKRLLADQVVLALPPDACCQIFDGAEKTSLVAWRNQAKPITVACLDLVLRKLPNPQYRFVMGMGEPILFSDQSRAARLSDSGWHVLHLVKYHGRGAPDAEDDKAHLERVMDTLQPGWRNETEVYRFLPRMTVMYDFDHLHREQAPGPRVPEVNGLYVAGDWAGDEELLADAAAASAQRAATALLADHQGLIEVRVDGVRPVVHPV